MNCHFALRQVWRPLLGAGCLILACGATAGDLNRCRDPQGHVLLTDQPCAPQGMETDMASTETVVPATASGAALVLVADGENGVAAVPASSREAPLAAIETKRSPWADLPHPLARRPLSLDASTLQAARNSAMMDDVMRRQRKVATR
jgi:hypothetical protein